MLKTLRARSRQSVRRWTLVVSGVLVPLFLLSAPARSQAVGPPNIVIIVTDDQPVATMDAMGFTRNWFRSRGVVFSNGMVPTALCAPSRASLLTGRLSHTTGVYVNDGSGSGWSGYATAGWETNSLPVWLHADGYRTGLFGKYLNHFAETAPPGYVPPGWDQFATSRLSYYNYKIRGSVADGQYHGFDPSDYSTRVYGALAQQFVTNTPADQPLFLYFAPFGPHRPYRPDPVDAGTWNRVAFPWRTPATFEADLSDKPAWVRQAAKGPDAIRPRQVARLQRETVQGIDQQVRSVVADLQSSGRLSNTLIFFTSDNGLLWGQHGLLGKSNAYDPATRVPLLMAWPGVVAPSADARLARNVDVTATIAQAAGLSLTGLAGHSLLQPVARTGFLVEAGPARPRPAYCGWRTRRYLYVRYATREQELYDYRTDPYELQNQAANPAYHSTLASLRSLTRASCVPVPPGFQW